MVTWRWTGYNALIYLAAMQGIPDELYEAAAIDGAGGWKQFFHVTIPMLRPTIIFTVIISTIGGLQLFTEPYLFEPLKQGATGGSARQYQTVVMYMYEKAFGRDAVQLRLRRGDRLGLVPADRADLARELPDRAPDQDVRGLMAARRGSGRRSAAPSAARRSASLGAAGPLTYVFLILVALVSIFPLYWSLVVASHDNSAVRRYPPVLTPGGELWHNISRVFNSGEVNVDFWKALMNSTIVASCVTVCGGLLQRARGLRVREAALPRQRRAAARDRDRDDDGPGPARRDPALHRDGPASAGSTT